jgi:hypothetical protein
MIMDKYGNKMLFKNQKTIVVQIPHICHDISYIQGDSEISLEKKTGNW